MKILLLTPSLASWTKQEMAILQELGHTVHCLYAFEYGITRLSPHTSIRTLNAISGNILMFLKAIPLYPKFDLIYCWWVFSTGLLPTMLGKLVKKPVLLNAVGGDVARVPSVNYGAPRRWYSRPLITWTLRNATKVISVSKDCANWAKKWGAKDVTVIHEGIDTNKFTRPQEKKARAKKERHGSLLLTVSPLEETDVIRKDFASLLIALREVTKTVPNAKLIIVGRRGSGYPIVQQIIKDLKIEDHVIFTGLIPASRLIDLYNKCDIFVLPSLHEGFPTVCAEAQASGKPVVSTNTGSIREVIKNGQTGILVNPKDPEALAKAITELLSNSKLRHEFGESGRKRIVRVFSKEVRKRKMQQLLSAL
jgi:glycosyltransferase involved in cell wall biosynthesis